MKEFAALRDEAFRAVEAINERHFTTKALEGCIESFARHIYDLTDALAERDASNALLGEVAHAAWHLMDDSGEEPDSPDYLHYSLDHHRLSDALDALEAAGWDAHPEAVNIRTELV